VLGLGISDGLDRENLPWSHEKQNT